MEFELPPGVSPGTLEGEEGPGSVVIDNRTGLDDDLVLDATRTYVEEYSAFGPNLTNYQMYSGGGASLMAKTEFRTPGSVADEIRLARHLAERDDDVAAVMGEMIGLALSEGMEVQHADEKTQAVFEAINEEVGMEGVFAEMYREWLIASQVNTAMLFSRTSIDYEMSDAARTLTASMAVPRVGVLASENIRVVGNDTFGTALLAYEPDSERLRRWLLEYFDPGTTPARKAEMGRKDRVAANLYVGVMEIDPYDIDQPATTNGLIYLLNPKIVQRTTMPKGQWRYPRPLLTRNFPLLEAKRLLNIMDFALLQGGSNYIVVAKKGSDQRPAKPQEIANLRQVIRRSTTAGVIVGDHRLNFEIITPKLDELLNAEKRKLVGRKLAMAMMRVAEHATEGGGTEAMSAEVEMYGRVVSWDRKAIQHHIKRYIYREAVARNGSVLKSPASIWFPKIILQGSQYFTDFVLKLRDRGDIPRKAAVQAAGFDYEAGLQQRKRELAAGDDKILIPGTVPHTSPQQPGQQGSGPQDLGGGRPPGAQTGTETGPNQKRTILKTAGETIKAWFDNDPEVNGVVRMGEATMGLLEEYADRTIGRITGNEKVALELTEVQRMGSTIYVPVNPAYEVSECHAVRLSEGLSVLVGSDQTDAIVAKVLCFREPQWNLQSAEEAALRWGFTMRELPQLEAPVPPEPPEPKPEPEVAAAPEIHVHLPSGSSKRLILRDKDGNIIGSEEVTDPEGG
jgi:hypothetical protein